jgi:hypothetical protein
MRITQTFILRLLVDQKDPKVLHGMLQNVASGEQVAFNDGPSLLASLHSLIIDSKPEENKERGIQK